MRGRLALILTADMAGIQSSSAIQRAIRSEDASGLQRLVADCFADYPHCFLDVELEEPGLLDPVRGMPNGQVVESGGRVVGCISFAEAVEPGAFELKKLYIDSSLRGRGWGRRLVEWVEQQASARGGHMVELWSDTRFDTAHAVYQKLGYRMTGIERPLHDISMSHEFHFRKELDSLA